MYNRDPNFASKYSACVHTAQNGLFQHNDYLFKGKRLCVPKRSIRRLLVKEAHDGGLMGHFGVQKILDMFVGEKKKKDYVCLKDP